MRILVTGASGLLGLNLALEFAPQHTVYGVVNSHAINGDSLPSDRFFGVFSADLLVPGALEQVLETTRPDWIIHCAALANLDACEAFPQQAQAMNAELPGRLAGWVNRQRDPSTGLPRLIHVSTDSVFDGMRGDYSEEDEPNPLGVYSCTKLAGERLVLEADPQAIVARVNLFGWSLGMKRSLAEIFVYNLQAGKRMMGFIDVFFCPLLVNDIAGIFLEMLANRLTGLYHVVSSESMSKCEFGLAIAEKFGLDAGLITPTRVADAGLRARRSPNLKLRTEKLAAALGKPLPRLSPAIRKFWELYQQGYPQWLQGLAAQPTEGRKAV